MTDERTTDPDTEARDGRAASAAIRPADAADLPQVEAIVEAAYGPYVPRMGRRPGPMDADYAALIEAGAVFVTQERGMIAGLVVLQEENDGLLLDNVAVAPEWHGHGLGRRLVAFAEDEARRRGHRVVRLYTHETMVENVALYTRLGFVETGRATQNGFRRIFMEKAVGVGAGS